MGHFVPLRRSRYLIFRVLYGSSFQRNSNYYNLKIGVFESSPVQFSLLAVKVGLQKQRGGEGMAPLSGRKCIKDN